MTQTTYIVRLAHPGKPASEDMYRTRAGWRRAPVLGRGFATRRYAETIAEQTRLYHRDSVITVEEHKVT